MYSSSLIHVNSLKKRCWLLVLCSLRHLVYCIFDLLLEFLVPEIPEETFQKSLVQTLSKNPEKLLAWGETPEEHLQTQLSSFIILSDHWLMICWKAAWQRGCSCSTNVLRWECKCMFLGRLNFLCPHFKLLASLRPVFSHVLMYRHTRPVNMLSCICTHVNTNYIWSSFDYMRAPGLCLTSERVRHVVQI